ncbi:MAG: hypothetical protein ACUVTP_12995 [Candidatus Fervidibacter sp.]|uniref:hypothetical protein n=1 Tax=Candidatus Fervidibacter sp. TaxID=3100871 RepID=UPI004048EFE2
MPKVKQAPELIVVPPPPPPTPPGVPLSQLHDVTGKKISGKLRFPDGSEKEVSKWKDLLVEVASWALPKLQQAGKLPMPIGQKRMPISSTKNDFRSPKDIGQGWYVETWHSAERCVRLACRILKEAGVSPDKVMLLGWQPQQETRRKKGQSKP